MDVVRTLVRSYLPPAAQPFDLYILIGTAVLLLVTLFVLNQRRPSNAPRVVSGKFVPFVGCALKMQDPIAFVTKMKDQFGPVFTLKVLGKNLTYLISPESQQQFFKATDDVLSAAEAYKFMTPIFGKGVVYDAPTETMIEQVKLARGGLTAEKLRSYVSKMVKEAETFFSTVAPNIGDKGQIDLIQSLADLTINTASRCLLGDRLRSKMGTRVTQLYHDFDVAIDLIAVYFGLPLPLPKYRRRDEAHKELKRMFLGEIADRRAKGEKFDDLVDTLMNAQYKDGRALTDEEIGGMLIGVLFAGQHTSSITAAWTGLELQANPAYLKRVMDEQKAVMAEFNGELTFESLKKMTVLENAVKEALRLHPPLIFLMRKVMQPLKLEKEGLTIPVGDFAVVSPTIGHRNPDVFTNPDKFDPDRFDAERKEHMRIPFGWFGFGGGRHGCIGEMFGIQQVKTIWALLLRDFKWEPMSVPPADYTSLVVGPMPPCVGKVTRINKPNVA